ncbi:peroxiredoxin [Croceicoccus mobilis]|uniref:thioredoxin-dependent peroxiredoxin n=1 Tax=Croceicoccus mobilis TaxID=1703339 RepID=A0A916Z1I2_9SPHN|nr:peroxiredoxin [Croceicoccus mobilis]GGD71425.1 peroxiredoxin [Croceicoccus mobilis]
MSERPDAGDAFPTNTLETPDGGSVSIKDFTGKPAVVFFYPKDNTPGCTNEAKDFTALKEEFDKAGVAILGVSKDPPKSHVKFIEKQGLTIALASDTPADSGKDGLAEALGIWVEKNMYGRTYMGMERTTYLVAADGTISQLWRKVKVKGHAEAVLEAAKAL